MTRVIAAVSHLDVCDVEASIRHEFKLIVVVICAVIDEREIITEAFPDKICVKWWCIDVTFDFHIVAYAND